MFAEVNNLLDISSDGFPAGKNFAVIEGDADASFITHHFITHSLKTNRKLILVSALQSFAHYNNVANKLGVNLQREREAGNVFVIDVLNQLGDSITTEPSQENQTETQQQNILRTFFTQIRQAVLDAKGETYVVIDDLAVFLNTGIPLASIRNFIRYLKALLSEQRNTCLVQVIHNGSDLRSGSSADDELDHVTRYLCHVASHVVLVNGLPSGYCRDVHGQVEVLWHDVTKVSQQPIRIMQFRIMDKSVKCFPPGMSAAVLGL